MNIYISDFSVSFTEFCNAVKLIESKLIHIFLRYQQDENSKISLEAYSLPLTKEAIYLVTYYQTGTNPSLIPCELAVKTSISHRGKNL